MQFNPETTETSTIYKLLTGAVVPRPIGWISTVDNAGVNNLAPYSFFNAFSADPPHVIFGSGRATPNEHNRFNKDTVSNIMETGEFVVNMVSEATAEAMNLTSATLPPDVDEFVHANLTAVPSEMVAAPRVGESLVNFECKMVHSYEVEESRGGGSMIVIGRVVMIHVADEILGERNRINYEAYKPVGRLAGGGYCRVNQIFDMPRPA
ncbi:MAG: flavin reductase family protein [Chloroflexota bacterium]